MSNKLIKIIKETDEELFEKIMHDTQYLEIRHLVIRLFEKTQNKPNFLSKSIDSLIQIFIGIDIGILLTTDKDFTSIEYTGLALSVVVLIILLFVVNFIGDKKW